MTNFSPCDITPSLHIVALSCAIPPGYCYVLTTMRVIVMNDQTTPPRRLIPVPQWNNHHEWPPQGGLRHLIFHARDRKNSKGEIIQGNGLEVALLRVGRRILIDESKFFQWLDSQQKKESCPVTGAIAVSRGVRSHPSGNNRTLSGESKIRSGKDCVNAS